MRIRRKLDSPVPMRKIEYGERRPIR